MSEDGGMELHEGSGGGGRGVVYLLLERLVNLHQKTVIPHVDVRG